MQSVDSAWKDLARLALETVRGSVQFADVRLIAARNQVVYARNERIQSVSDNATAGIGVRCLANGAWGFASTAVLTPDSVRATALQALAIAKASAMAKTEDVVLAEEPPHTIRWRSPRAIDPFEVPIDEKTGLLLRATETMRRMPDIRLAIGYVRAIRQEQVYLNTEGSDIERDRMITEGVIMAHAVGEGQRQSRSYHAYGRHAGWEHIVAADFPGNAERVAREARMKLTAEPAPVGRMDLILDPEHLHLTIHESIGHATELDRVLGYEADYAGTSFATVDKLGKFQYGSRIVNVVADNVTPEFLASTGADDDGVEGQKWDVIREGVLVDYGTSREVAPKIGAKRSHGTNRADGWHSAPIVRIPNIGLLPGSGSPEDLIADTNDGIYIEGAGTWSIDQRRLNFQFGGDMFWRIKDGRKVAVLRDVVYRSNTPEFWNACDAVCGPEDWRAIGVLNCGKGQPGQVGFMSHYSSTSRFRGIEVGRGEGS
ncbi:MAG: TldD/PmbA family protein [Armatimonadetes bacterium]|jgi:TldD protein|nr:TldD/PmbA family protein [Armatimonadota bacterium]MCA1996014.1 TldD/PmbA family protein [Armatimonadota bacterium]